MLVLVQLTKRFGVEPSMMSCLCLQFPTFKFLVADNTHAVVDSRNSLLSHSTKKEKFYPRIAI